MRPSTSLNQHREEILRVVQSHHAANVRVFGSVLRGEDVEGSDLDLLVDTTSETTLFDIGAIRHQLRQLLQIPVDVLTPKSLPASFREQVLSEARPL